jgi:hypothetical protein
MDVAGWIINEKDRTMISRNLLAAYVAVLVSAAPALVRAEVQLHTFQAGERARAADVNGNFNNLKVAVEAAERRNAELTSRIRDLEAAIATVRQLNGALSIENLNGVRTVRLSGVNLQVVNGLNRTDTVNGAGNIIVGYDEANTFTTAPICSKAHALNGSEIVTEGGCLAAGGIFSTQQKSGSHNLVMGLGNGYSSFGGIVSGRFNYINEMFAAVVAGVDNRASGRFSGIFGGQGHLTQDSGTTVLGGIGAQARGHLATVVGGVGNVASGENATIAGGERNVASGRTSYASGGLLNTASGQSSTATGGRNNTVSGLRNSNFGGDSRNVTAVQPLP